MQGLVKVGKTTRDPDQRAGELSATTGVPTPFVVVYHAYFSDCGAAEAYVHAALESKNFRVSSNREFFSGPVAEAVRAVVQAEQQLAREPVSGNAQSQSVAPQAAATSVEPWGALLEFADRAYFGTDDEPSDEVGGVELYRRAAKLGASRAYLQLGRHALEQDILDGQTEALSHFRQGAKLGCSRCLAEMGWILDTEDSDKCWAKVFKNIELAKGADWIGECGMMYVAQAHQSARFNYREQLLSIREEMMAYARQLRADCGGLSPGPRARRHSPFWLYHEDANVGSVLEYADVHLFEGRLGGAQVTRGPARPQSPNKRTLLDLFRGKR